MTLQELLDTNAEFKESNDLFMKHHFSCPICIKAARLRFAGGTTEQINLRRCELGKKLAEQNQSFITDDIT